MSTMRPRPRLLALPVGPFRLGLGLGLIACLSLAGCSSTSSDLRSGGVSKTKTALAVGDKLLPVVGGEPGSSVATEDAEPTVTQPSKRAEGRISGRVYDADGHPAPNAQVRLAVSSASGGKVVRAATDESGGFTLHGLRPGTSYTLIAESSGSDGVQSGRARATASQSNVRISLASSDASGAAGGVAEAPRINVNRVSDRDADEESNEPENPGPAASKSASGRATGSAANHPAAGESRVNEEDLPPADEAEATAPGRSSPRGGTADARWRPGQGEANSDATVALPARSSRSATKPAPVEPEARGTAGSRPGATSDAPDDEGPNPLPPALDSGQAPSPSAAAATSTGAALARGPVEADPFADESPRIAASERGQSASRSLSTRTGSSYDSPSRPTVSAPLRPAPADDAPPGALVVTPETFGPVVLGDDPFTEPTARTASTARSARTSRPQPRNPSEPASVTAPPRPVAQPRPADATDAATGGLPPALEASPARTPNSLSTRALATATTTTTATATVATRPRPTWGDVASSTTRLPPLEGASDAKTRPPVVARRDPPVRGASATVEARSATGPTCEYDDRRRRMIDFRLPDLDGKPVRFADLDADLILLDFWGTWCQPCIRSIPHLVDLQAKATGKRLKVVGIACEPDAPDVSARKVAASARKLGINYPVLLSRNDGTCPLQEALHVQALPTMVLLDRQGRVLWRDQGATPSTLARLDHMIATATGEGPVMR